MLDVKPFVGGVPLYRQVQAGIEDMIRGDPGGKDVPLSDAQLAERFGVSRITVRRAVDELVDAGVLYRIQGVGTFVRKNKLREKLTLKVVRRESSRSLARSRRMSEPRVWMAKTRGGRSRSASSSRGIMLSELSAGW